ncbi:hypothetical protein [Sutcliffiella deserti]|uniref:hypothetical protein n=1 Tax=Sutcliffiella deserti TaxID=2875501 RepID=UPI001CBE38D7|nr:hypothetical protein [Sutcliffiella deserti]
MVYLLYISGAILLIGIGYLIYSTLQFRKETKPTFSFFQTVSSRLQEENEAIKQQTDQVKDKKQMIKNDIDWKKAVFSHTIFQFKKFIRVMSKSSSKQKVNEYSQEM